MPQNEFSFARIGESGGGLFPGHATIAWGRVRGGGARGGGGLRRHGHAGGDGTVGVDLGGDQEVARLCQLLARAETHIADEQVVDPTRDEEREADAKVPDVPVRHLLVVDDIDNYEEVERRDKLDHPCRHAVDGGRRGSITAVLVREHLPQLLAAYVAHDPNGQEVSHCDVRENILASDGHAADRRNEEDNSETLQPSLSLLIVFELDFIDLAFLSTSNHMIRTSITPPAAPTTMHARSTPPVASYRVPSGSLPVSAII
eukprot:CAMPEP_0182531600 /NCGR_PEP_ID=MMETSP1323-20130603/9478_1 /TAXON_ID=236787 /ORGANISM="Florenciella parvula, Strain RCC1693" /LENGTH=258 /DNA_ID=CAMNT_0024741187 /DNA_START=245 /DNA_END=1021 /DNA_ORIENTATION=-